MREEASASVVADATLRLGRPSPAQARARRTLAQAGFVILRAGVTLSTSGPVLADLGQMPSREADYWVCSIAIAPDPVYTSISALQFDVFSGNPPVPPNQALAALTNVNPGDFRDTPSVNQIPARVAYSGKTFYVPWMDHLYLIFNTSPSAVPVHITAIIGRQPWDQATREDAVIALGS